MKLFLLGAAALIAAPVMAQSQSAGAPAGASQTMPGPVPPVATTPDTGAQSTPPADGTTQTPPAGDTSMSTTSAPPADGSMQPPMGAAPTGGQIVMGPMNTTPPPAAVTNPPVCKRGQTDDCIEPGARRARRR